MAEINIYERMMEREKHNTYVPSEEDKEFNRLCDEYRERFGGNGYGVEYGSPEPIAWHNERMREALRTGVPIKEPERNIPPGVVI